MDDTAPVENVPPSEMTLEKNGNYLMIDGDMFARCVHSE
jgi:hypothetical protein